MYASLLGISGALHLSIFEQPEKKSGPISVRASIVVSLSPGGRGLGWGKISFLKHSPFHKGRHRGIFFSVRLVVTVPDDFFYDEYRGLYRC